MLSESDLKSIKEIVDSQSNMVLQQVVLQSEEIKKMLRHNHNHIERVLRKIDRLETRMTNGFLALMSQYDDKIVDSVLNPDIDWDDEDEQYSPIDETDRIDWEKYLEKEKKKEEIENLAKISEKEWEEMRKLTKDSESKKLLKCIEEMK